jgi:LuxR family transcriptional regulator, maltose regulon positive regulatory protein
VDRLAPPAFRPLRAKLDAPTERSGVVPRQRVVDGLTRAAESRFVTVIAPPGYGKTTALGQWSRSDPRHFAWLSLDRRDNDPVLLLSYVAEALNDDGSVKPSVRKALRTVGDSLWSSGLPQLGAALAARKEPVVLVLDDVHELTETSCLDVLAALSLHVPAGSTLVLSGRTEPEIGLARLRADGELSELDESALMLSDVEAQALLAAAGVELTPTEANELNRHAEGWAAGLYLAALSLARGKTSVAAFDGSDRFVTDYLRAEELSHAGPDETEFLLRSSVLETMTAPLCDAVLERADSAEMLERLERENLFVVPLDNTRSAYRYHHLFREMLFGELERSSPDSVAELRRRAAAWCEADGAVEEAIEYASTGRDTDTLARLVAANVTPYFRTGRVTTAERWLSAFDDDEQLRRHPDVAMLGTWLYVLRGSPEVAERWALAVEAADRPHGRFDDGTLDVFAAAVRALLCKRGVEQMLDDATTVVNNSSAGNPLLPAIMLLGAVASLFLDDERAEERLHETAEAAAAAGAVWAALLARCELALLALDRGDLTAAQAETALATESVDEATAMHYVVMALLHAVNARLAIAQRQGARARQSLAAAQRLRPMLTHALPWFSVQVRLELAVAHLAVSDRRGAATLLREADEILHRRPRLGNLVERAQAIRAEIAGTVDTSSGWASTLTAAELRLLPLLTTHLSFREIAERLFVSRNTVKTQAISIYRKLDASSRSEAIERAVALGLVDAAPASTAPEFTPTG